VVKRPGREADHSTPSSTEVKDEWSYISTPQYVFMVWCLIKLRDNFTFYLTGYYLSFALAFCMAALGTWGRMQWSRVLIEKLTVTELVSKFPAFYVTQRFITIFARARPWSLF